MILFYDLKHSVLNNIGLFCYLLKMLQSPADEGGDMGHEGLTAGGEAVLNSRRHFGINLPADKPYYNLVIYNLPFIGSLGHFVKCAAKLLLFFELYKFFAILFLPAGRFSLFSLFAAFVRIW